MPLVLKKVSEEKVRLLKSEAARRGLTPSEAVEQAIELWARVGGELVEDEVVDDMVWEAISVRAQSYRGRYVVIAGGRVQGVYDSLEEAAKRIRELRARGYKRVVLVRPGVDDERGRVGEWLGSSLEPVG